VSGGAVPHTKLSQLKVQQPNPPITIPQSHLYQSYSPSTPLHMPSTPLDTLNQGTIRQSATPPHHFSSCILPLWALFLHSCPTPTIPPTPPITPPHPPKHPYGLGVYDPVPEPVANILRRVWVLLCEANKELGFKK
jgi:hypothetical protein